MPSPDSTDQQPESSFSVPERTPLPAWLDDAKRIGFGELHRRLEAEGHGEANPIAPNDSPANMQLNRRTELTVID